MMKETKKTHLEIPPQAVDLEIALLGSILLVESLEFCLKTIKAEEFYTRQHMIIYQAMETLHNGRLPINVESLSHYLKKNSLLEDSGGTHYLAILTNKGMAVPHHIDYYAKIIHQMFVARKLIELSGQIEILSYDPQSDVSDIMELVLKEVAKLEAVNIFDMPKILHYERIFIKSMILNVDIYLEYRGIVPDEFFLDKIHQKFWNVMKLLSDNGIEITLFSVEDILKESKNESSTFYLKELFETTYKEEASVEYLYGYLRKYYEKVQFNKMHEYLREFRFSREPEEILARLERYMDNIRTKDVKSISFSTQLDSTFSDIISKSKDADSGMLKTGFDKLDRIAMFSTNDIVVMGASRGSGKTRFSLVLAHRMLTLNEDCAACIICMEETADKIVRVFISIATGITDSQQQSKYHTLTDQEKQSIMEAKNALKKLDMEIIDHPVSIKQANAIFSKFAKKRPNKKCIFILDNLMLLQDTTSEVKTDDMIAKELVYIKKKTGGLLFALHHSTKDQEGYINSQEAYRPKETHLKGSTRLVDVADHILLLNLPSKYADLVKSESIKPPIEVDGKKFKRDVILKSLLITELSKNRDGSTKEEDRIIRFFIDLGTLKVKEWR